MNFPLITADWLLENLDTDNLVILDASMSKVVGKEPIVYDRPMFIPGARKFDLEQAFCDPDPGKVHGFPTEEQFTSEARKLGIHAGSTVIIYDNQGIYSAPRAWWIFQAMGHEKAFVLDGGLPEWLAGGKPVLSDPAPDAVEPGDIRGRLRSGAACDSGYLLTQLEAKLVTAVDARSPARFNGTAPEPREGVRSGHIPGSLNLPFAQVLDEHRFKDADALNAVFAEILPSHSQQAVFSCGSGITACIILMAAVIAGHENTVLYDGSWADWGSNHSLPVAT